MNYEHDTLMQMNPKEFDALELALDKLIASWEISNLRGAASIFHDDQQIGQNRRELQVIDHPSVDKEKLMDFRTKAVVDSLEGNMLIHPLTTPVIEINDDLTQGRATWWSIGIEGLSKFRELPMPIISLGMVFGNHIKVEGEWRILSGAWQRTTKNEYHAGWVDDMQPTNTRPPLTPEQDHNMFGKYAYQKEKYRQPAPEPPRKDTFEQFPDEACMDWLYINLNK